MARSGLAVLLLLLLGACRKTDPATVDRADLQNALNADETLDEALKDADDAEHAGRDDDAADILKRTAAPAADAALAAANALAPRSDWGRKEKDALVGLERDRKDELARYETALRSGDVEQKITALKKQLEIEQRAKAIAEEVAQGP